MTQEELNYKNHCAANRLETLGTVSSERAWGTVREDYSLWLGLGLSSSRSCPIKSIPLE